MLSKNHFNFLLLLLISYRAKHLAIFLISLLLVTLISSVLFIVSSLKKDIDTTLDGQADFVLQKYEAGKVVNIPKSWIDEFIQIEGVTNVIPRVYGMHFYEPAGKYFMIVGVDFFDEQVVDKLQDVVNSVDADKFLSKNNMIIGAGVKELFDYYQYKDYYTFRPPDRSIEKVYIYDTFPEQSSVVSNDMIIMDIDLATKILGLEDTFVTDIALKISNPLEVETIRVKLILSHFNMRIIEKGDIKRHYANLFNYKGGVFLILYIVVMMIFLLILYQRYSMINHVDAKEIAILRLVGWRIDEVIWLKVGENFIVALFAYLLGVILAYIYVFGFDAPLLKDIFLGDRNLNQHISFMPSIDLQVFGLLFLFFVIPFIIAILIPVWRVAITEPVEVMR